MNTSKTLSSISENKTVQLPLPGFRGELESPKPGWKYWIENMGNGRYRVHSVKI